MVALNFTITYHPVRPRLYEPGMTAQELTQVLRGAWQGRQGRATCPICGDNKGKQNLSIGVGRDGKLLLKCFKGEATGSCSFVDLVAALEGRGLAIGNMREPDERELQELAALDRAKRQKIERLARALWENSQPIEGTLAERYLRGRSIKIPLPSTLRFNPDLLYRDADQAAHMPGLIALIEGAGGFSIHRTYLTNEGSKAAMPSAKKMLGPAKGGAVRLRAGRKLVVAEGIETALSVSQMLPDDDVSIWAALSASGIEGLTLPSTPGELIIAIDNDAAGQKAGRDLKARAQRLGWQVGILSPRPGFNDFNDQLLGKQ